MQVITAARRPADLNFAILPPQLEILVSVTCQKTTQFIASQFAGYTSPRRGACPGF
jgi:hypothetical protein